jgi:hypothetical protein
VRRDRRADAIMIPFAFSNISLARFKKLSLILG